MGTLARPRMSGKSAQPTISFVEENSIVSRLNFRYVVVDEATSPAIVAIQKDSWPHPLRRTES